MPCDDGMSKSDYYKMGVDAAKTLTDERTDMLCRTLKAVEDDTPEMIEFLPQDVQAWWAEHKVLDKNRRTTNGVKK